MATEQEQIAGFDLVERVVADPLRFKRKLAIGEDAYTSLRVGKTLGSLWEIGGVAATGGSIAASQTVAGTFFASSGWLASIGLGAAAATPIGWVVGIALASGTAYYGVTRLLKNYSDSRVEVIPKFINSPIDVLGMALLDLLGALSMKVAQMDGEVVAEERAAIRDHFITDWGYDPEYVAHALAIIEENSQRSTMAAMIDSFASYAREHPDCNFQVMRQDLVGFLREVAQADDLLDEREDLAIEKIDSELAANESGLSAVAGVASSVRATIERLFKARPGGSGAES